MSDYSHLRTRLAVLTDSDKDVLALVELSTDKVTAAKLALRQVGIERRRCMNRVLLPHFLACKRKLMLCKGEGAPTLWLSFRDLATRSALLVLLRKSAFEQRLTEMMLETSNLNTELDLYLLKSVKVSFKRSRTI